MIALPFITTLVQQRALAQPVSSQPIAATSFAVVRHLQALTAKVNLMSQELDALKADIVSLGTEVTQAIALIQANASTVASAAADEAEITALESQVTSLRDQLAAALAPTPPAA